VKIIGFSGRDAVVAPAAAAVVLPPASKTA
jgi:hypothetical protein